MNAVLLQQKQALPLEQKHGIQVSLRKLFSENGIPVLHCCPECKSTKINWRTQKMEWHCIICDWRGSESITKVGYPPYHAVLVARVLESAKKNRHIVEQALQENIVLPIELKAVLEGEA